MQKKKCKIYLFSRIILTKKDLGDLLKLVKKKVSHQDPLNTKNIKIKFKNKSN